MMKRYLLTNTVLLGLVLGFTSTGAHAEPTSEGFVVTGSARYADKSIVVSHAMRSLPANKSVDGVTSADVSKRLVLALRTDLTCAAFTNALRAALIRQGFADQQKLVEISAACSSGTLKARTDVVVDYEYTTKVTTIKFENQGQVKVTGVNAMHAFWSVWMKDYDNGKMGPQLVARL